jgi:hypothetical protein
MVQGMEYFLITIIIEKARFHIAQIPSSADLLRVLPLFCFTVMKIKHTFGQQ